MNQTLTFATLLLIGCGTDDRPPALDLGSTDGGGSTVTLTGGSIELPRGGSQSSQTGGSITGGVQSTGGLGSGGSPSTGGADPFTGGQLTGGEHVGGGGSPLGGSDPTTGGSDGTGGSLPGMGQVVTYDTWMSYDPDWETSGYCAEQPVSGGLMKCISKSEALAYCDSVGGELPSAIQHQAEGPSTVRLYTNEPGDDDPYGNDMGQIFDIEGGFYGVVWSGAGDAVLTNTGVRCWMP